ncbi:ABC transporter substrate-binding protein [Agromyces sp. NPDC058484]|uniref:ABC transporter substrate-binding protein n=1 Tax=Agromyces sp. NPDC058484 TaxID=3346524 RepID=UPI00364D4F12
MESNFVASGLSRRTFIQTGALGLAVVGAMSLAGCTPGPAGTPSGAATEPIRGGRLKIGIVGGGSSEVISEYAGPTSVDHARAAQVYDTLVGMKSDLTDWEPGLAEDMRVSDDSRVMTISLRDNVVFHDGQPLTSEDVIANLVAWADPANRNYAGLGEKYDATSVRALDKLTVEVQFKEPWARPHPLFTMPSCGIASKNRGQFNGTGPFVVENFSPGNSSLMKRNPNYWEEGKPYVDEVEILSFSDSDALINATKSGEVHGMATVPFSQVPGFAADPQFAVLDVPSPTNSSFLVRTDQGPFQDVRARQGLKLLADRQQLVDVALLGFGEPGNDLVGPGLPFFDNTVPVPQQDVDEAKSLFKAAGLGKETITLHTADVGPGIVESAVLFAEQINKTGLLDVKIQKEEPGAFYDPSQIWMKMNFTQSEFAPVRSLSQGYSLRTFAFNETHWAGPERDKFAKLLTQAEAANDALATEIWVEAQQIWREQNGYLTWNSLRIIDVLGARVAGTVPHSGGPLGNYRFLDMWFTG